MAGVVMGEVRQATERDWRGLRELYGWYVEHSPCTMEWEVPDEAAWMERWRTSTPCFVAVEGERILGYAVATPFRLRRGYGASMETTVYVAQEMQGQGWGKKLYEVLLGQLVELDVHRAYAVITLPNEASERLHRALGYSRVGVLHEGGRKFGKWWNIALYERRF